jgi:protein subunit release factor B
VRCQRERQQSANRYWARVELCERLEKLRDETALAIKDAKEKLRRQSRPRPYGLKQKILKAKSARGATKKKRARVRGDE